jgi:hypothetical protein
LGRVPGVAATGGGLRVQESVRARERKGWIGPPNRPATFSQPKPLRPPPESQLPESPFIRILG